MKIKAKWKYHNGKKYRIDVVNIDYCCISMDNSEAVKFGEVDDCFLNRDENVNIASCNPYPEGAVWDEEAINFCPFCGEKIQIDIEC